MIKTYKVSLTLSILLALAFSMPAQAGAVLDRFLNNMILDSTNARDKKAPAVAITAAGPVGQTFTTGANTVEVSRIAVCVAYWEPSWTSEETLALTLWDSPAKANRIGQAEMPYKWREWEFGVIMFTFNAKVQPRTRYYFELTVTGGDGTIDGISQGGSVNGSEGYIAGKPSDKSIWFEIHGRPAFDRAAAYADRFSNWNLDFPGMEKVKQAVSAKDWDKATDALIAFYESRTDLIEPDYGKPDPNFDRSYADLVADMKIKDDEGNVIDLGPHWNYFRHWRTRGGVGLTRGGLGKFLAAGYRNTKEEKFAKAYNDQILSFMENLPNPLRSGVIKPGEKNVNPSPDAGIAGGSMGGSIGRGTRMNILWYYYLPFVKSSSFTRDVRAAIILDMVDNANVIHVQKGGGNRAAIMATALYEFAERHPELKMSKVWFEAGMGDLFNTLMTAVHEDGPLQEPTFGYHCLTVNRFTKTLLKCKQLGLPIDPRWNARTEKALEFIMYSMQPDWYLPARGDTGFHLDPSEYFRRMADYYGREDFRWMGSKSREGRAPLGTSWQFPITGWFVMRSDWTPDALYLNLRNGWDRSHGHYDELSVVINAYGSQLIIDPAVYVYGTTETIELTSTRSHATISVDNHDTRLEKGPCTFATMRTADYYNGTNAGYNGLDGITHTRRIAFAKPDYWLISDTVNGSGEHEVVSRFPFAPTELTFDHRTGACRSNNKTGNLLILPCPGSPLAGEVYDYKIPLNGLTASKGVKYSAKSALPITSTALFLPYRGSAVPSAALTQVGTEAYRVVTDKGIDFICFGSTDSDMLDFSGESCVLRLGDDGIRSVACVNVSSIWYNGRLVASSDRPVENLEIIRDLDAITIIASRPEPSLKVSAMGARLVRVGTGSLAVVSDGIIRPFASADTKTVANCAGTE